MQVETNAPQAPWTREPARKHHPQCPRPADHKGRCLPRPTREV